MKKKKRRRKGDIKLILEVMNKNKFPFLCLLTDNSFVFYRQRIPAFLPLLHMLECAFKDAM